MSTTRSGFFGRLRAEMARARPLFVAAPVDRPAEPRALADAIRREVAGRWSGALERFRREFERVGGVFHSVAALDQAPALIAALAAERGAHRLVTWHPAALGADLAPALRRHGLDPLVMPPGAVDDAEERARLRAAIAAAQIGVTGVDLAIAETGSLVLRSGGGRPRSTSLLPPYHVAVLDRTSLIESLAQFGVFLEAWQSTASPNDGAAVQVITGPSRTADIELTLTRGVHGPREVHAVFVDAPFRE
ncbi:MAG TPA: lactate utilization protein [Candidatus Binatia bacterium]|nr:lactate utilization protein [Candidatus Binatia bacterium]